MEKFDLLVKNFETVNKELKIVGKQLKEENKDFFNAIVENSTSFMAIIQDGKYVYANSSCLYMLHTKSSADIVGKDFKETVSPKHQALISDWFMEADKAASKTLQIKFECFDQSNAFCECNLAPFQYNKQAAFLLIGRDITDELKHRSELESEEKLRTDILNAFQEVIAFYGPDHTFLWLNDAGKKQLNIHDDSYIGKRCYKTWFNADKPCYGCPVVTRVIEPYERIVTFEDNSIWRIRHTPLYDNKGFLAGYIEFRTNITEEQNTKVELQKSYASQIRAELTNLFGHFEIDLTDDSYVSSPGIKNILGLGLKNSLPQDQNFLKYIHPDDSAEVHKQLELAYSGKKSFDRIFKIIDANCHEKTIRGIGEVKTDLATGNRKLFAVIQDITRISNLEKLIFDEREKYKMLAENAPFGLILMQDNKPVYINKTLFKWIEVESVSEFEQMGFASFFHPADKKVIQMLSDKIKENDIPSPVVQKLRLKDCRGNICFMRLDLVNNTILGQKYIQIVLSDITDDVIQEKKQKQVAADALYMNQKNTILSEIESVLTKVLGQKQYAKNKGDFNEIYSIIGSYKHLDKDWKMLVANFEEVHPGFFSRLKSLYPKLSLVDIKHCACIKMNMDTKEIARFFNIKVTSVQIARVRIKKKMNLPEHMDLRTHILNF